MQKDIEENPVIFPFHISIKSILEYRDEICTNFHRGLSFGIRKVYNARKKEEKGNNFIVIKNTRRPLCKQFPREQSLPLFDVCSSAAKTVERIFWKIRIPPRSVVVADISLDRGSIDHLSSFSSYVRIGTKERKRERKRERRIWRRQLGKNCPLSRIKGMNINSPRGRVAKLTSLLSLHPPLDEVAR